MTDPNANRRSKTARQVDQGHPVVAATEKPDKQTIPQPAPRGEIAHAGKAMVRAFLLKQGLRLLYALKHPALTPARLDAWLAWASRSRLQPLVTLARTIRRHRAGILAAIRLGLAQRAP